MNEANFIDGINGKYVPRVCFSFLKVDRRRAEICHGEWKGRKIKKIILFNQQLEILEKIGIYATEGNWHHLAQKILHAGLKIAMGDEKNNRNADIRRYKNLEKEIEFSLVNLLPYQMHEAYNKIFRDCLIPKMVMEKLDKIFDETEFSGDRRNDIIDLFVFIAVLSKESSCIDVKKICELKKNKNSIVISELLGLLKATEDDIREYIEMLFLYPNYWEKDKHFSALLEIHEKYILKKKKIIL